MVGKLNI